MSYSNHLILSSLTSGSQNVHISIIADPSLPDPPPPHFPDTSYTEESVYQPTGDAVSYAEEWETHLFLEREREQHVQLQQRWDALQSQTEEHADQLLQQQSQQIDLTIEPTEDSRYTVSPLWDPVFVTLTGAFHRPRKRARYPQWYER